MCPYDLLLLYDPVPCGLQQALHRAIVVWDGLVGVIGVWDSLRELLGSGMALRELEGLARAACQVGINIWSCPALCRKFGEGPYN